MKTIALVFGVSTYKDSFFETIPGAAADATRFASTLASWGFPKEWIRLVLNENATKANIIKTFYDCKPFFESNAKLIVYFAGHGIRKSYFEHTTPESSLVMHDTLNDDAISTGLRLVELMQLIRTLRPAQVFLFIDACNLRLNQIDNPLEETDILSTNNSKGLFCLLSAGIGKAYEDVQLKSGYFTNALLRALSELRHNRQANCNDIGKSVASSLIRDGLPTPEIYHMGSENIWPLEHSYNVQDRPPQFSHLIFRAEVLAKLQDYLVTSPDSIVWMWGEAGIGKTIIAEQFHKQNAHSIYTSIPAIRSSNKMQAIMEQIRTQKSELFFNHPPHYSLYQILTYVFSQEPTSILILDHLDRLESIELNEFISEIDKTSISCLLICRRPYTTKLFTRRQSKVIDWKAPSFSREEIEEAIRTSNLDSSLSNVLLNATGGNALKIRHMLAKLLDREILEKALSEEYIKTITSIVACGGFLDELLFCKIFEHKPSIISKLEKLGLIRYVKEGCFPHDLLVEMVEENHWPLDVRKACYYWNQQIQLTPYNRWACNSLVLLASQVNDFTQCKSGLSQCLETLNEKGEQGSCLIDLVQLYKRENWEKLLANSALYLIDSAEFQTAGEVLELLSKSNDEDIQEEAITLNARLLIALGRFDECVRLCEDNFNKQLSPTSNIYLRNYIGMAYYFIGYIDKALPFFLKNIHCKVKNGKRELAMAKYMAGQLLLLRGEEVDKCRELIESSLHTFEAKKYYVGMILAFNSLGMLSNREGHLSQATHYFKKSEGIAEVMKNKAFLLFVHVLSTGVYLKIYDYTSHEIILLAEKMETLLHEVRQFGDIWIGLLAQNMLGIIYAHQKELHKLQHAVNAIGSKTTDLPFYHIYTLSNLGLLSALKKDFRNAKSYSEQACELAKKINNQYILSEIKHHFQACAIV